MKFDRRIFSNIILFLLIIIVIAVTTMCQSTTAIKIAFADDLMALSSMDYSMNIPYADVLELELVDAPDLGKVSGGKNKPELQSGVWENETWGEYHLCFNPNATNCIVVRLRDGQIFVFNCNTNEATVETYKEFLTYLQ